MSALPHLSPPSSVNYAVTLAHADLRPRLSSDRMTTADARTVPTRRRRLPIVHRHTHRPGRRFPGWSGTVRVLPECHQRKREAVMVVDNILWDAIQSNNDVLSVLQFIFSGVK
ncbi:hypothetical protein GCM10009624_23630 [Gordonia sinesedis]